MNEVCDIQVKGDKIVLYGDGKTINLVNVTTKAEIDLTIDEANMFFIPSKRIELLDQLNGCHTIKEHEFAKRFTKNDNNLLYAYTDTTTLKNAQFVMESDTPHPECILDLAMISYLCAMYDKIVINLPESEIPEPLKECFIPLEIGTIIVGMFDKEIDPRFYLSPHHEIMQSGELSKIDEYWSRFLGRKVNMNYRYVDHATDSPSVKKYIPGGDFPVLYDRDCR